MSHRFKSINIIIILFLFCSFFSCTKFVEVQPPDTAISGQEVYQNDATAIAAITGIYAKWATSATIVWPTSASLNCGLSSDELTLFSGSTDAVLISYYKNALSVNYIGNDPWESLYPIIYTANSAIEGLINSQSLTQAIKQQLLGEAKFIRAFSYFYLTNLYGELPLVTSTDYKSNSLLSKSGQDKVYDQIISDLKDAQQNLSDTYLDGTLLHVTVDRLRPTKWAAAALLSRVYLYTKDYQNALMQSNLLIANTSLYDTVSLNNVFLMNSREAIWQFQPVYLNINSPFGDLFNQPTGPNSTHPVNISSQLLNAFEPNDLRRTNWVDSFPQGSMVYYYPYKYKVQRSSTITEYTMVLRLGEQYLIRAESKGNLNDLSGGMDDLNVIRHRAGLADLTGLSQQDLITSIHHERQVELFTEWGDRWLELKRTGKVDSVMGIVTPIKGGSWNSNWQLYPIPSGDIMTDPNLTQNAGY